jgi:NAD(P)-dependent dehydrogenase (short-subunit alcohol dehydrogenase family)
MDLAISGRRAAVAAASQGLGRGTAAALAAEGVQVAICSRSREKIEAAAAGIPGAIPIVADVSTADGAAGFVREARDALGGIDILVANGGGPPPGTFASTDLAAYTTAFEQNCLAVIAMCTEAVPDMQTLCRQGTHQRVEDVGSMHLVVRESVLRLHGLGKRCAKEGPAVIPAALMPRQRLHAEARQRRDRGDSGRGRRLLLV